METNITPELVVGLSKIHGEIENVAKSKNGYNYKYAELSQVTDLILPLLAKYNLAVSQLPNTVTENGLTKVVLLTLIMSKDGGILANTLEMGVTINKGMSLAQSVGSVITYARRYSLTAMFGMAQADDDNSTKSTKDLNRAIALLEKIDDLDVKKSLSKLSDDNLVLTFVKYRFDVALIADAVKSKVSGSE